MAAGYLHRKQERHVMYKHNIESRSLNHCCAKAMSVTCSGCVSVALGIQHRKRMHPIISSPAVLLVVPYLSILSHTRHGFLKNVLLNTKKSVF